MHSEVPDEALCVSVAYSARNHCQRTVVHMCRNQSLTKVYEVSSSFLMGQSKGQLLLHLYIVIFS